MRDRVMQTLTIEAATQDSARDLHAALTAFGARLLQGEDGSYRVEVTLGRSDREIVQLLNAIEQYVTERRIDAARIRLNDRDYTLHGAGAAAP